MSRLHRTGPALLAVLFVLPLPVRAADSKPLRRIAFGSCAHQDKPQPIWESIVATRPDLLVLLGDNVYADTKDMDVLRAKYAQLAAQPGFRKLRASCPVQATWDDHDYGLNDSGADYPKRAESQQVFLDFFQVPKDSPRRQQAGVYNAAVYGPMGQRVQVILLDTRYFRSPLKKRLAYLPRGLGSYAPNDDPGATLLGEEQWKWLGEQLRVPAELRLIGSSIQVVAEDHGFEKWMNFPRERARLFRLLRASGAGSVVFLSGDRHLAELSVMDAGLGYPVFDLTSSGLTQAAPAWRPPEVNRHRVATMTAGNNFGIVLIDWDRPDPLLRLQARDEEGEVTLQHKIPLGRLRPSANARATGPGSPAEAARSVGKKVTVQMKVAATGATRDRQRIFLNSERDYRSAANFTVVLDLKAAGAAFRTAGIAEPRKYFAGQTVRVTGTVSEHQGQPQIVVTDPQQIEIVGKKE